MDALEYMHRKGVAHLDLSYENLGIGFRNDSKIYIFGNLEFGSNKHRSIIIA